MKISTMLLYKLLDITRCKGDNLFSCDLLYKGRQSSQDFNVTVDKTLQSHDTVL